MMERRIILAAAAGAVVIFIQAGLFFGFLFAGFFRSRLPAEFAAINRTAPNFPMLFVADLLYAGMLAFLFAVASVNTFRRGAGLGMLIGFLVVLHFDLISSATTYLTTPASVALNVGLSTLMSGLGGGVIAVVLSHLEARAHTLAS
jgi:predicted MPP superfamily phosphohydrolase